MRLSRIFIRTFRHSSALLAMSTLAAAVCPTADAISDAEGKKQKQGHSAPPERHAAPAVKPLEQAAPGKAGVAGKVPPAAAVSKQEPQAKALPAAKDAATKSQEIIKKTGQTLENLALSWLKRGDLQHSQVGLEIMELPSGRTLYSYNGNRRLTPASTAKVFSTACAFDTFGGSYVYKTRLLAGGKVEDSTIHGDLIIEPSQDPTFSREDLRQLLAGLKEKKITHIDGTVKIAPVAGGYEQFAEGWLVEDWGQEWMPVSSNFVIDRNIAPGAQPMKGIKIVTEPAHAGFSALNHTLLNSGISAGWLTYNPDLKEMRLYLSPGMSPKAPLVVSNPDDFNRAIALSVLQEMGIHIGNHKIDDTTEGGTVINEHLSKPLSTIIQTTLHESDNLYADQILRTIGAARKGTTTLEDRGLNGLATWFSSIGVPTQEVVLYDGCGLSRKNCVSPHALCATLRHMATPTLNGPYLGLLKYSGAEGGKRGNFRFKTGAMESVRSLAGVLETAGGQNLSVAIIVNGHTPSVRGLRSSLTDLIALLNSITAMTIPPPPAPTKTPAGQEAEAAPPPVFIETSRPRASTSRVRATTTHRGRHSRRRH